MPAVVEFLICNCEKIFDEDCVTLFGNTWKGDLSRQDSGNEESDSLHSLQSSQSCKSVLLFRNCCPDYLNLTLFFTFP